ncbi:Multidrug resistance protein MdtN [Fundidesulfovibrio magnetotacticus]|uniref:Multidrug resistance protein MdtN n=1 Tax=Fundidesulfovibrio magnetotacticus TaxID=2730080 RepID=A0A6V8LVW8_9BACT|nr:HlyD family efflux transporter periplasmic adaptor subunit [Fundidesulfovibrio magnetotacticus]GFK95060.1 Multidrug resistance protein MdtN [Fundidesulfovibrio magnetotacticus]
MNRRSTFPCLQTAPIERSVADSPSRRGAPRAVAPFLALLAALACAACSRSDAMPYQGYVEGEFVYVATQLAGRLDDLPVARGDRVRPGQRLFTLEHALEQQGVDKAQANLRRAQDTVNDLKKGLRPEEIDQILARIAQSEAELALAKLEMDRRGALLSSGSVAKEDYDRARTAFLNAQGRLSDVKAQLATGKLGSRVDQILAAQAQVRAAQAELDQAAWMLDQKLVPATLEALVFDLLHYKGEWVAAGSPVVKLLPPGNVKVRFFLPEAELGRVNLGDAVRVACDGCPAVLEGRVSFVFPQVEYTPPVIFSQSFREKLVFMVEARFDPETSKGLKPGQPVSVALGAAK